MNDGFARGAISKPLEDGQASFAPVGVESQSMVDTSQRLCQLISFMDEQTPSKKAKPAGVMCAEIWVRIGETLSAGPSELSLLALDTNSAYLAQYSGTQPGQKGLLNASLDMHPRRQGAFERNRERDD